jgi:hypothetical protein
MVCPRTKDPTEIKGKIAWRAPGIENSEKFCSKKEKKPGQQSELGNGKSGRPKIVDKTGQLLIPFRRSDAYRPQQRNFKI